MKICLLFLTLVVYALPVDSVFPADKIDDSEHYYMTFTHELKELGYDSIADIPENVDNLLRIKTNNEEQFVCQMPTVELETSTQLENYNGPTPEQLIKPLYEDKSCSFLIDVYWSYEVCHGSYVLQYHEDGALNGHRRTEYYLGNLHRDYALEAAKNVDTLNPPKRRIETEDYPYYSVSYSHGTTCDLTGKPRTTDVIYICVENQNNKILSVLEVASCHYEVVIMTGLLCNHPAYRLTEKKDHQIKCFNIEAKDDRTAKPISLQNIDDYHDSTFKREYTLLPSSHADDENEESYMNEQDLNELKKFQTEKNTPGKYELAGVKRYEPKDTLANNKLVVEHTVDRLLTGLDCIVGGEGWWKYEFCYGKHVIQYHVGKNGEKTEIVLGIFDEEVHKAWVTEDQNARGPKIDKYITEISHIYTQGDICEEMTAHRSVVVNLRCHHSEYSALAVSMELNEPKTCQYVLTLNSERFCEPMQYADNFGLIHLEKVENKATSPFVVPTEEAESEEEEKIVGESLIDDNN